MFIRIPLGRSNEIQPEDQLERSDDAGKMMFLVLIVPWVSSVCVDVVLHDAYGDGWNGAMYAMHRNDVQVANGTLADGRIQTDEVCLDPACYTMSVTPGRHPNEITWTFGDVTGGAPDTKDFFLHADGHMTPCATTTPPKCRTDDFVFRSESSRFELSGGDDDDSRGVLGTYEVVADVMCECRPYYVCLDCPRASATMYYHPLGLWIASDEGCGSTDAVTLLDDNDARTPFDAVGTWFVPFHGSVLDFYKINRTGRFDETIVVEYDVLLSGATAQPDAMGLYKRLNDCDARPAFRCITCASKFVLSSSNNVWSVGPDDACGFSTTGKKKLLCMSIATRRTPSGSLGRGMNGIAHTSSPTTPSPLPSRIYHLRYQLWSRRHRRRRPSSRRQVASSRTAS